MSSAGAPLDPERARRLLCELGDTLRDAVLAGRDEAIPTAGRAVEPLHTVVAVTAADTIYGVDRIGEAALLDWFVRRWPPEWPVRLVVEGLDDVTVPAGVDPDATTCTCIVDPIDGTRELMYDKRSAWVLAAVAPTPRDRPARLRDVVAAAMTELPPVKQRRADQLSAVRGAGPSGLVAERVDLDHGRRAPIAVRPSSATDLRHGWASFARFFPEGKELLARFEARLWEALYPDDVAAGTLAVFDDQYLATGGQLHELLAGHDRMLGDLRPLAFAALGLDTALACHPYDACCTLLLDEAGCVVTAPDGAPLDVPLDTTTPVAWVGFANPGLAEHVRPALDAALASCFPASPPPA